MPPCPEILSNIDQVPFVIKGYICSISKHQDIGIFFYCYLVCHKRISKEAASKGREEEGRE